MRYHLMSTRMATMKKKKKQKMNVGEDLEKLESLLGI